MKKIININLYGRVIPIEDAAYDSLQRYIESLRRYFAAEEGRDEIINDIESRISELMNDKIKKGAPCITEADIAEIINAMGRVEDFEAADRSESLGAADASASSFKSETSQQTKKERFKGRLSRDVNDKFLGGVCSGLAAYMNVDPTVVRLLFAIITFGGFGLGFLLYIILWIVLPANTVAGYTGKRFFRNPDDRVIGGVAGGLAAYFNKSAWTIRAIFAAPILLKIIVAIFHTFGSAFNSDIGFDIATGSLTGTFIIAYIILWIVLPEARTPYDKMEMRGEHVDVNRIKQNVQEGMSDFRGRAREFGEEVKTAAQNFSTRASEFANTQGRQFAKETASAVRPVGSSIGHAIGVLFKSFFLFIAGVMAFFLFVVVLVFLFGGVSRPVNAFLLDGFWQKAYLWGVIIFFLAVPLIAILTWIVRRAMKVRSQSRYLGWTFGGLWTLGWICLPLFITSIVRDLRTRQTSETNIQLSQSLSNKLIVTVPGKGIFYSGDFNWMDWDNDKGWDIVGDSLKLTNVRIEVSKSEDSFYHVTLHRIAAGSTRAKALQRAEKIDYTVTSMDSVLALGSGFAVSEVDKYRDQKVMVEIKVPVGKQIRFDLSVGEKLNPYDIRLGDNYVRERNWNRRNWEVRWDNNYYYEWKPDTDYYMTTEGELKQVGIPDETPKPTTPKDSKKDSIRKDAERKIDSIERTGDTDTEVEQGDEETTKAKPIGGDVPTPMPFVPTIF